MSEPRERPAPGEAQRLTEPGREEQEIAKLLPPARSLVNRLFYLLLNLLGAAGWTWLAIALPLPVISEYLTVKNALIAFVAIVWVGRTIVDTFFYDRHP